MIVILLFIVLLLIVDTVVIQYIVLNYYVPTCCYMFYKLYHTSKIIKTIGQPVED